MSQEAPAPSESLNLASAMLGGPETDIDPNAKEQGREDQLQAFQDFTNEALPMSERLDSLAFLVELLQEAGPTEIDE